MTGLATDIGMMTTAVLLGAMLFFSAVAAPVAFIKLPIDQAGSFIRSIFPWYYLVIIALAAIAAVSLAIGRTVEPIVMGMVCLGSVVARQVLMPQINKHRDAELAGDKSAKEKFDRLHRLSVFINTLQLAGIIGVLVALLLAGL